MTMILRERLLVKQRHEMNIVRLRCQSAGGHGKDNQAGHKAVRPLETCAASRKIEHQGQSHADVC